MSSKTNTTNFKTYKEEGQRNQKLVFETPKKKKNQHLTKLIREKKEGEKAG